MLTPCPSTKLKAVNAVKEIAQPIAIGTFAQSPINIEPRPATKHVATKRIQQEIQLLITYLAQR